MPLRAIRTVITALLLSVVTLSAAAGQAAPNGYTQIPIAKVFGDGVAAFSFSSQLVGTYATEYTTQYGILNRTEVGLDYIGAPESQRTALGNAKYLLAHSPGHLPDIACGATNIATGQRAVPYLVATTQPGAIGVSLGTTRPTAGGFVGMGGVAWNATPTYQIVGDYVAGRSSYETIGVIATVTPQITVNLAYARPNSAGPVDVRNPKGYVFNCAYVFHLKGKQANDGGTSNKHPAAAGGT